MIEQLREIIARAEELSEDEQAVLAEVWAYELEALEEREWDELLAKPGSAQFLQDLVAQGRQEHEAGETEEVGEDALG